MGISLVSSGQANPLAFQRAMVFIDGTNLVSRLRDLRLRMPKLAQCLPYFLGGRQLLRTYFYTTEQIIQRAQAVHGPDFLAGMRPVLGDGILKSDGNVKEKGVDALLIADLVYHAAAKNCDFALVVSHDTDFVQGLRRVEDFGCRTAVLGIGGGLPDRLKQAADEVFEPAADWLVGKWAERVTSA